MQMRLAAALPLGCQLREPMNILQDPILRERELSGIE